MSRWLLVGLLGLIERAWFLGGRSCLRLLVGDFLEPVDVGLEVALGLAIRVLACLVHVGSSVRRMPRFHI